jgi:ketosteroid isomerase-like protein
MGQANVDLVRRLHKAWNEAGSPVASGLLHPAVEWVNPPGAMEPGVRRGLEGFAVAAAKVAENFDETRIDAEQLIAPDRDQVVVIATWHGRGRSSAVVVERRMGYIWTVRARRIVRFEWFREAAAELAAAGIAKEAIAVVDGWP